MKLDGDQTITNEQYMGKYYPKHSKQVMGKFSIKELKKAKEIILHFGGDKGNRLGQPLMASIDSAVEFLTLTYK